ncbi:hypothetical protein HN958_00340 [Candidatus Falkowbacteria bacterium]|nr:hypothetical protein [Candidatus Falkowbacteria bacterium]MBT7006937.1 hypothetical protein [Candidatus Falkowbacteria bacterium]
MQQQLEEVGDDVKKKHSLLTKILELQEKEKVENQEKEKVWTYEMFVDWARDEIIVDEPEKWLKTAIDLNDLERPTVKSGILIAFDNKEFKRIPPGLICREVFLRNTQTEEISIGFECHKLVLDNTQVKDIPERFKCDFLSMYGCKLLNVADDIEIGNLSISKEHLSEVIISKLIKLEEAGKIGEIIWK